MRVVCIDENAWPEGLPLDCTEGAIIKTGSEYNVVEVFLADGYVWYVIEEDESVNDNGERFGYWERAFSHHIYFSKKKTMKTIAIDFDGVIHKYSKGWQDGSCYDQPVDGVFDAIKFLIGKGYNIFIFSTRNPKQIKQWMKRHTYESEYFHDGMGGDPEDFCYPKYGFTVEIIPWWKKFWSKPNVVGITRRKLPAMVYIDDRAMRFDGNWLGIVNAIQFFKTYQDRE